MSNLIPKSDSRQRPTSNEPVNCTSKADRGLDLKTTIVAEKCVIKTCCDQSALVCLLRTFNVCTVHRNWSVTGWCKIALSLFCIRVGLHICVHQEFVLCMLKKAWPNLHVDIRNIIFYMKTD